MVSNDDTGELLISERRRRRRRRRNLFRPGLST